jgi:HPt (histidine-containing phosphotransfer) domain-containing protein
VEPVSEVKIDLQGAVRVLKTRSRYGTALRTPLVHDDWGNEDFSPRLQSDAATLVKYREGLRVDPTSSVILDQLQSCAHKLAGAAGVYRFEAVSRAASVLEDSIIDVRDGRGVPGATQVKVDALLDCLNKSISGASVTTDISDQASRDP